MRYAKWVGFIGGVVGIAWLLFTAAAMWVAEMDGGTVIKGFGFPALYAAVIVGAGTFAVRGGRFWGATIVALTLGAVAVWVGSAYHEPDAFSFLLPFVVVTGVEIVVALTLFRDRPGHEAPSAPS